MKKILPLLFLITLISCNQKKSTKDEPVIASVEEKPKSSTNEPASTHTDWKTLNASDYSIQYPSDWTADESGQMGTKFALFSSDDGVGDKFSDNINLITQDLTGRDIDLDKYTEISEGQVKNIIKNSELIESKRIENGSSEYQRMIYSGDQNGFHLQWEQYYWVKDKTAYVLTLTCEAAKFNDYKKTGEDILNSFRFK